MEQMWHRQTECALPPALSENDLIAAIDDEAPPSVTTHLKHCPYCRARAQELAFVQQQLRAKLYRLFCPSSDQLIDYFQGLLPNESMHEIRKHLATCPHCSREIQLLEQTISRHRLLHL
jgi:anti-sigma factor RsiW